MGFLKRAEDFVNQISWMLPIKDLVANMPESAEAIIVELDYCNIEMFEALQRSYDYLTRNNLAVGNK